MADNTFNRTTTPNASIGLTTTFSLVNCKCLSYLFPMRSRSKGSMSPFPAHSSTAVPPDCGLVAEWGVRPIRGRINYNAISSLIPSSNMISMPYLTMRWYPLTTFSYPERRIITTHCPALVCSIDLRRQRHTPFSLPRFSNTILHHTALDHNHLRLG